MWEYARGFLRYTVLSPVWSVNAPTVSHPSWTVICSATGQQDRIFYIDLDLTL
jgi:hypothetical protein